MTSKRPVNNQSGTFLRTAVAGALLAALILSGCGADRGKPRPVVIKFASVSPPSNPIMKTFRYIEKEIAKRSDGELRVELYDSGRLGGETDNVERLRLNTMEMTDVATSVLGNFTEEFFVFDLPFLFDNRAHQARVLEGEVGRLMMSRLEEIGLKGLAFFYIGTRNLYSKKPVVRLDDVAGLKIRVMESRIMQETINALGAHAIPLSFSELYNALQQDVVDGAENNPFQYLASGHVDLCPYFTLTEHFMVPEILLMSASFYNNLSPGHRRIIDDVVGDSKQYHAMMWRELEQQTMNALQDAGAEVTAVDKEPFRERVSGIYSRFKSRYGSELFDRIARARE